MVFVQIEIQGDLIPVEGPRAEFEQASLLVEGEVSYVDRTRTLNSTNQAMSIKISFLLFFIKDCKRLFLFY